MVTKREIDKITKAMLEAYNDLWTRQNLLDQMEKNCMEMSNRATAQHVLSIWKEVKLDSARKEIREMVERDAKQLYKISKRLNKK